ncbi:hypothetical protein D3C84_834110 [compost metagenome]
MDHVHQHIAGLIFASNFLYDMNHPLRVRLNALDGSSRVFRQYPITITEQSGDRVDLPNHETLRFVEIAVAASHRS